MVIRQNASGYSLYELIITVGIAALLMSLGVPSYGKMLANHHLKVEVDAIFHAVHLARKESVVRPGAVPTKTNVNEPMSSAKAAFLSIISSRSFWQVI